ncbi:MAG TPA: aldo/keto reductase [Ilumatobacteraceae bacterium]|nr:aldo/keto reductase [Ilumatobacteraceae bacterium]
MIAFSTRPLGRSGIEVSSLGVGCWAIGGPWTFNGAPAGWSEVDDTESVRALRRAFELGVTFFDTAANYGAGHSERVLGQAFAGQRDEVVIATKFGYHVDDASSTVRSYGSDEADSDVAGHVRADLEASLERLDTDYVDVYQLHVGSLTLARALEARDVLDELVAEGKVRTYGWSTDRADVIRPFATSPGCGVVQQGLSVLDDTNPEMLALCEELDLASINRSPLGMGLLTGKFTVNTTFPSNDQRRRAQWHPGFKDGTPTQDWLDQLAAIRDVLTSEGRTLAQGALAWIWARSPMTIPIPGFKTVAQVEDNCGALDKGPLTTAQMAEIDSILGRVTPRLTPS